MKIGTKRTNKSAANYYQLVITSRGQNAGFQPILHSNSERACVIATLQDTLRSTYTSMYHPVVSKLVTHIDLLGFSITRSDISLVLFALTRQDAQNLGALIVHRLTEFQHDEYIHHPPVSILQVRITPLPGPRNALHTTTQLHARHQDWEHDRYSSVGFYLHGRRGEWMRLWRITSLYGNDPEKYRALLCAFMQKEYSLDELTLAT